MFTDRDQADGLKYPNFDLIAVVAIFHRTPEMASTLVGSSRAVLATLALRASIFEAVNSWCLSHETLGGVRSCLILSTCFRSRSLSFSRHSIMRSLSRFLIGLL